MFVSDSYRIARGQYRALQQAVERASGAERQQAAETLRTFAAAYLKKHAPHVRAA